MPIRSPVTPFRRVLSSLLVAGALACPGIVTAAAPQVATQVPGYYRLMVGEFEITALYDGAIELDTKLLKNADGREVRALLARKFLKGPAVQTAVNAFLVNTGGKLVLVDAGAASAFGPGLGRVEDNLRASGYTPEQVDVVLVTHLHGDHVSGLLTADGRAAFPNAEVWSAQADNDYWLDAAVTAAAPEGAKPFFRMAQAAAAPYQASGRWKTFSTEQAIVPGITAVPAHGHTPGHSAYLVESADAKLLVWGDIVHNHAVQFAKPSVAIEFDVDPKQAVAARRALFERASREKLLVGGMHLPFPGVGHVRREKSGYAWVPVEFSPLKAE